MQTLTMPVVSFDNDFPSIRGRGNEVLLKTNLSLFTETTETTTSFSEQDDMDRRLYRIDPSLEDSEDEDEPDSMSIPSARSSLNELDDNLYMDDNLPDGVPGEILVIDEEVASNDQIVDVNHRLMIAESLAQTYKAKMKSTEELADSLHEYLGKAQQYAEDVLADRNELLSAIHEMETEEKKMNDQSSLMKLVMGFSLLCCLCGGSYSFLMCSVGLFLISDVVNSLV